MTAGEMAEGDGCLATLLIGKISPKELPNEGNEEMESHNKLVLIPGLPNDLALQCLARVPRCHHLNLRCVCTKWRDMVASESYYFLRKRLGLSEGWIYAFSRDYSECLHWHILDPVSRTWKELPGMPGDCLQR
jgi:hypothetical protein